MTRAGCASVATVGLVPLAILLAVAEPADPARVTLVAHGVSVALSESEEAQIARRVEVLIVGCAITSVTSPGIFAGRSLAKEWQDALAGSHLFVRFLKPVRAERGGVQISEVVVGLQDASFIGPELSRHQDGVVGHVKCDGHRSLALMCELPIRRHLLPGQARNCAVYDRIGEPREKK